MRYRIRRLSNTRLHHLEAAASLVLSRVVYFIPFRWLAPRLGTLNGYQSSASLLDAGDRQRAVVVSRAIGSVQDYLPWHSSCLVRALAACMMLRRRRLPSHLQLGVKLDADNQLVAHAWVTCGDIEIVGTEDATTFQPLAAFTAER